MIVTAEEVTERAPCSARDGFGLFAVLLVLLVAGAVASAAAVLGGNSLLVNAYAARESSLEAVAEDGLELARAKINGDKRIYNDTAFVAIESDASVTDVNGNVVPGVTRTIWVGPAGVATGQYGVFGTIVVIAKDRNGNQVIRRGDMNQESFSKYAYFTNVEGSIVFGGGDRIQGPVHSNDQIRIDPSGATFLGPVSTGKTIYNRSYATYAQGYKERVQVIPMPQTADLQKLKGYAQSGNTYFKPQNNPSGAGVARMRIEFLTVDLNGDGLVQDEEAFIRVYTSQDEDWVVAKPEPAGMRQTYNCGMTRNGHFDLAPNISQNAYAGKDWRGRNIYADSQAIALTPPNTRCYLGGDARLFGGFKQSTAGNSEADPRLRSAPVGSWLAYAGTVDSRVSAARASVGDAAYLIPISHALNPNYKGVIYVEGKVAVSGVVHGHVTLAAEDNIVIADDLTYAYPPGVGCKDLLGLFSAADVVVSDNVMNAPIDFNGYKSYGATTDESISAVILALSEFKAENHDTGSRQDEPCQGTNVGRGCLFLTGGVIQNNRGAVGTTIGTGYIKRYSYDNCAADIPPPYFPTTGRFKNGLYYEVNPRTDVTAYLSSLHARH